MAKLILLNKCSGDKKNQKNNSKEIFWVFLPTPGKTEHRDTHVCNTYIHRLLFTLRQGDSEERSKWSDDADAFNFSLEMLPCYCFHLSSAVFNILTLSSKAIWEMGGYLWSTEQASVWHWHQPGQGNSHHTVKIAKPWQTQRDGFLGKSFLRSIYRKTWVKAKSPYPFLVLHTQRTQKEFYSGVSRE